MLLERLLTRWSFGNRPYLPLQANQLWKGSSCMSRLKRCLYVLTVLLIFSLGGCATASSSQPTQPPASTSFSSRLPTPTVSKQTQNEPTPVPPAEPRRLLIPAIEVDAPIEKVGILVNGDLATPRQHPWEGVGWYAAGSSPGERGSAVLNGHLDRPGGDPAVFWRLRELHPGDRVLVTDAQGKTWRFHVLRIASYRPEEAPVQAIFADRSGTYLNLITCAGDWIPAQRQTTLRLVVYTVLG